MGVAYACERCGTTAEHEVTRHVRKVTVCFVPVFPVSTKHRDRCTACGRVLDISREQARWAVRQSGSVGPAVGPSGSQLTPPPTPQDHPASSWAPQDRPA